MSGPDYLFLISNGFSARMICQTELLPGLRRAGLRIGILTADREDASLRELAMTHGIELYEYGVKRSVLNAQLFQLRKYFLNDIRANPALLEKYMSRKLDPDRSPLKRVQTKLAGGLYWLGPAGPGPATGLPAAGTQTAIPRRSGTATAGNRPRLPGVYLSRTGPGTGVPAGG